MFQALANKLADVEKNCDVTGDKRGGDSDDDESSHLSAEELAHKKKFEGGQLLFVSFQILDVQEFHQLI